MGQKKTKRAKRNRSDGRDHRFFAETRGRPLLIKRFGGEVWALQLSTLGGDPVYKQPPSKKEGSFLFVTHFHFQCANCPPEMGLLFSPKERAKFFCISDFAFCRTMGGEAS